jgi:hypothetical protein
MSSREIRIFLSTPSDIVEERQALSALVAEINDVVAFLAPERNVRLKLVHYETDSYPDVGRPQDVIDEQIPVNYDIYVGIMWKRAGTPTKTAPSGTIHEFKRALAQRERTGKPTIMFYFCQQEIPLPATQDELNQLSQVIKFREDFQTIALGVTYPTRAAFRERARVGLLRAVADSLQEEQDQSPRAAFAPESEAVPDRLEALCREYDRVRQEMPFGSQRTQRMTAIVDDMKVQAATARGALAELKSKRSAGHRLAAIGILQAFPSADELAWLADRLDPDAERAFIGFQAAVALQQAVRSLPRSDCHPLRREVERALKLASRNPDDPPRIEALKTAIRELDRKCG